MKKFTFLTLFLFAFLASAIAQDSALDQVSWGSALLGALGTLVLGWIGGLASKARQLGEAMIDRWIDRIHNPDMS